MRVSDRRKRVRSFRGWTRLNVQRQPEPMQVIDTSQYSCTAHEREISDGSGLTFFFLLLSSTGMSAAAETAAAAANAAFSAFDLRPRFLGSLGTTAAAGAMPCSCS